MVPRKPVRFLGLLGTLRPRNGSRVEFPETACGLDSGPAESLENSRSMRRTEWGQRDTELIFGGFEIGGIL